MPIELTRRNMRTMEKGTLDKILLKQPAGFRILVEEQVASTCPLQSYRHLASGLRAYKCPAIKAANTIHPTEVRKELAGSQSSDSIHGYSRPIMWLLSLCRFI